MLNLQNLDNVIKKLDKVNPMIFENHGDSFKFFTYKIHIQEFRNIRDLTLTFEHPITILSGSNKIGKTSILLLIACSHYDFYRYDSTKPETVLKRHSWGDVMPFTKQENTIRDYEYHLFWRVGKDIRDGKARRLHTSKSWSGVGKATRDRKKAKIRDRHVRLIDLERILPARNFSNSLMRKIAKAEQIRLSEDIEKAFSYIFCLVNQPEIYRIGSHVNKFAYLICSSISTYSSYNAATGEESILNILVDIFETPCNSLILIDELEVGFHPDVQRKLADVIKYVSWNHKKQFIVTTHSPTLLSSFSPSSRRFLEKQEDGTTKEKRKISVNAAFSKMDSNAYPLLNLFCEDKEAFFAIRNLLVLMNERFLQFDKLVNVIMSGPADRVKNDYLTHKRNYEQYRIKIGYACVFDGDYHEDEDYSHLVNSDSDFAFFLYPYDKFEKILVRTFLDEKPNERLESSLQYTNHHGLFQVMCDIGLTVTPDQALNRCWDMFVRTEDFGILRDRFYDFIIKTTKYFSDVSD
jgi:predicted ATP-dependent endonuclease of OLD family